MAQVKQFQQKTDADESQRNLRTLIAPIEELSASSDCLFAAHLDYLGPRGESSLIPRFLFTGPGDRGSFLRVGVFAGIHGDEVAGSEAAVELLRRLHQYPEFALGYELFVYPVCNPWGFARNARWLKSGADMNREFWRGTDEIEVLVLEGQLLKLAFDGIVSLHADDTSSGLYGFVKGHQLTRHVLEPSLEAASKFLPRNFDRSIDNFHANQGIIIDGYTGVLGAPPTQKPRPFEIVSTKMAGPPELMKIESEFAAALKSVNSFHVHDDELELPTDGKVVATLQAKERLRLTNQAGARCRPKAIPGNRSTTFSKPLPRTATERASSVTARATHTRKQRWKECSEPVSVICTRVDLAGRRKLVDDLRQILCEKSRRLRGVDAKLGGNGLHLLGSKDRRDLVVTYRLVLTQADP
jgi:hypothetical protein